MVIWAVSVVDLLENSLDTTVVKGYDGMTWQDALVTAFPDRLDAVSRFPDNMDEALNDARQQEWVFDCVEYELDSIH